ncbi:MFS transporter [Luteimicrobium sp. DT211]|uniref:MFS transporter n=1 Tax=Luteimicrobium sp. DT211 TaxID=3393412 RepID=UPI003CECD334
MATETLTTDEARTAGPSPRPDPTRPDPTRFARRELLVLVVLCAAQFMVALDFSILNVALPTIGTDLAMSPSTLQWAITAFALPSGGFLLLLGRTGDLFGRRRLFLGGLALFGAASLVATLAPTPTVFLVGRALQGVGAAAIVPTAMALLTTTFEEGPRRARALGVAGTLLSLGFTVGMVLGGVLTDTLGWRSTMAILAVATVVVLPLARLFLHESRHEGPNRPRLDVPGAVTVTGGLLAVIYALSTAAAHGFGHPDVLVALGVGAALLVAFVVVESRTRQPLVSLPLLRRRTVAWGNLGGLVTFSMMSTVVFVLTLYLQDVLGLDAFRTGLVFGVQGVLSVAAGVVAPRFVGRFGAPRTLVGALVGQGLFVAGLLTLGTGSGSVWLAVAGVSVASACHLGAIISYGVTATSGVADHQQGLVTGLVTTTQQVGITVGIPLLGVLATTAPSLERGVHLVLALDAAIVLVAAVVVGLGLRVWQPAGVRGAEAAAATA